MFNKTAMQQQLLNNDAMRNHLFLDMFRNQTGVIPSN